MPAMTSAYRELEARFRRLGTVEEAVAMLHWDAAAMMPPGGAASRTEQLATLRVIAHQLLAAPDIADLLAAADGEGNSLDAWQRANIREMRRRWRHAAAIPDDLIEALSRACSESETVWRAARPADDFAAALPGLERVLGLTREVAVAKAAEFGTSPYEALLDQYEPGGARPSGRAPAIARAARALPGRCPAPRRGAANGAHRLRFRAWPARRKRPS